MHRAVREFSGVRKVESLAGSGKFILVSEVTNLIGFKESGCESWKIKTFSGIEVRKE